MMFQLKLLPTPVPTLKSYLVQFWVRTVEGFNSKISNFCNPGWSMLVQEKTILDIMSKKVLDYIIWICPVLLLVQNSFGLVYSGFGHDQKWHITTALSFYGSQKILGWSKFFVPYQKLIYILRQSQTFSPRSKDDLRLVNTVLVPAQNFFGMPLCTVLFLV